MQLYQQVGLCVAPLLGTVVLAFSLLQPTLDEAGMKQSQLDSLKQQYDVLEIKLAQKHRLLAKRALIHKEIQKLRTSVPDKPDLDLLIFDLEKMCKTNNTSLLGVEAYDPGRSNKKKENLIASLVQEVGGKLPAKPEASAKSTESENRRTGNHRRRRSPGSQTYYKKSLCSRRLPGHAGSASGSGRLSKNCRCQRNYHRHA
ncbi:MAG: hypothetical protein R3C24_16905 [Cyanobacteriota/Melainabacteria group bacterium]